MGKISNSRLGDAFQRVLITKYVKNNTGSFISPDTNNTTTRPDLLLAYEEESS